MSLETGWTFAVVWEEMTRRQVELILSRAMIREARTMVSILDVVHSSKPRDHRERLMRIVEARPPAPANLDVTPEVDPVKSAEQWAGFAAGLGNVEAARRIIMRGHALRRLANTPPEGFARG